MKRIRKDAVVACIVTVLCVGGILFSGCGKETVAQNTQGQNRYDGFCRYDSDDELVEDQISRWAEKLLDEGKIEEESELYPVNAYLRDVGYSYVHFRDFSYREELEKDTCYPYEIYLMSVTDDGEITYYYSVMDYYEVIEEGAQNRCIYVGNIRDEEIEYITNPETAQKVEMAFGYKRDYDENGQRIVMDKLSREITELFPENMPGKPYGEDPIACAEFFLHLQGGEGEFTLCEDEDMTRLGKMGTLCYQFAEGDIVHYCMFFDEINNCWRPVYCTEKDDELYPDIKGCEDYAERKKLLMEYELEDLTAEDLRSMSNNKAQSQVPIFNDLDGDFVMLCEIPGQDVRMFGMNGGTKTILQSKDQVYVMDLMWAAHYDKYAISCGDYDGDGDIEYGFVKNESGGAGSCWDELYVIEITEDNEAVYRNVSYFDIISEIISAVPYHEIDDNYIGFYAQDDALFFVVSEISGKLAYRDDGSCGIEDLWVTHTDANGQYEFWPDDISSYCNEATRAQRTEYTEGKLLDSVPLYDLRLYGVFGGKEIAFFVGDQMYLMECEWQNNNQSIYIDQGDYDNDGLVEYSIYQGEALYVIEINGDKGELYKFDYETCLKSESWLKECEGKTIHHTWIGRLDRFIYMAEDENSWEVDAEIEYLGDGVFRLETVVYSGFVIG